MRRLSMIVLAALVAAGTLFASGSQEQAPAVAAVSSDTALKGDLVVYSTIFAEYAEAMKAGFEKKYPGVTVHVVNPGGTEAMMKKVEAEKDNPQADVIHSGATLNYAYAKAQGLIAPYKPNAKGFKPSIKLGSSTLSLADAEDYYHVWSLMFSGIMYNKQVMDQYNLPYPKSYKDLTNPVYKDKIISANPLKSSTAVTNVMATIAAYGDGAWDLWNGINANLPYYSNSSSKIYTLTKKGEFAMAICLSRPVFVAKQEGYPVDFIFPEDASMVADNAMALVKGAKHPELAKKFIDFILSDDMQRLGAKYLYIPVKTGVVDPSEPFSLESVSAKIKNVIIPDEAAADASRARMQETFGEFIRNKTS